VVSSDNKHVPTQIIDDLKDHTCEVSFIPAKARTPQERPGGYGPTGPEFALFLERVLKRVNEQGYKMTIRNFDAAFGAWHGTPLTCEVGESCGYAVVNEPCDFFDEGSEWLLGNIHETHLRDLMDSEKMHAFRQLKSIPHPICEPCEMRGGCGRGCPRDRWLVNGDYSDLSPQCAAAKYVARVTKPQSK
jgi:uncharacterized protein